MYIEPAAFRAQSAESLASAEQSAIWTQCLPSPLFAGKKAPLKTFEELQPLIQQARKRELKLLIRENSWPINSPIRASLWPALCRQHQHGKSMLDGFYWDMVTQSILCLQLAFQWKFCNSFVPIVQGFILNSIRKVLDERGLRDCQFKKKLRLK
ncbi:unnamed protein product [Euphydryas editha]|uniref:Uncharacterized protein n=1 Tax=Euphydryas editha TaxID=104508 RepID=A0AAU9V470_EUPED|nr:unnamed protein product [Euphydryas editha]